MMLTEASGANAVIGLGWGDEGKGGKVDFLAREGLVVRFAGGDNAGHTVTAQEQRLKLHLIPSGILRPDVISVIGSEVVVNPFTLVEEIKSLREAGIDVDPDRFLLDKHAQLIMPWHRMRDGLQEAVRGGKKIGTTGRGIGPAYADRAARIGLKVGDLFASDFEQRFTDELAQQERLIRLMRGEPLVSEIVAQFQGSGQQTEFLNLLERAVTEQPFDKSALLSELDAIKDVIRPLITNTVPVVSEAMDRRENIIFEGAQGVLLDLTHGTLPYVTASHPGVAGITVGFGIHRDQLNHVVGIIKAFATRVGEGPMPTEQEGAVGERLRGTGENPWDEFGTTTGRPRRCGWLDIPLLRFGARIGGATCLAVTKLDVLAGLDDVPVCTGYRVGNQTYTEPPVMDQEFLISAEPIYEHFPGWQISSDGVRAQADIPPNALAYLRRIEELTRLPVKLVSFGPERDQNILFP